MVAGLFPFSEQLSCSHGISSTSLRQPCRNTMYGCAVLEEQGSSSIPHMSGSDFELDDMMLIVYWNQYINEIWKSYNTNYADISNHFHQALKQSFLCWVVRWTVQFTFEAVTIRAQLWTTQEKKNMSLDMLPYQVGTKGKCLGDPFPSTMFYLTLPEHPVLLQPSFVSAWQIQIKSMGGDF